jgi:hypothetical protein
VNRSIRDALTECASFIRHDWNVEAGDAIEVWRDRNFPEAPPPAYHRWKQVKPTADVTWVFRRCERCDLVEDFGPLVEGGRLVARYVATDGSVTQKKHNPVPPCRPAAALSQKGH